MSIFVLRMLALLGLCAGLAAIAWTIGRRGRGGAYATAGLGFAGLTLAWGISTAFIPDFVSWSGASPFLAGTLTATGFLFAGAAWPLSKGRARQRVPFAVLCVVLAWWSWQSAAHLAISGDAVARKVGAVNEGVCLQPDSYTCAPACGATLLRLWGQRDARLGEVAFHAATSFEGTELVHLARGVRGAGARSGLTALAVRTDIDELERLGVPAVIGIDYRLPSGWTIGHAVCVLRLSAREVVIGDPLDGPATFEREPWLEKAHWDGIAVLIAPSFDEVGPGERAPAVAGARAALARAKAAGAAPLGGLAACGLAARARSVETRDAGDAAAAATLDAALARRLARFAGSVGLAPPSGGRLDWRTHVALTARDPRHALAGRSLRGRWTPPPEGPPPVPFDPTGAVTAADRIEAGAVLAIGLLALAAGIVVARRTRPGPDAAGPDGAASSPDPTVRGEVPS